MEEARFDEVYRAHVGLVYRYCLFRTGTPELAEDLSAEAFARLLMANGRVTGDHIVPWLLRVARNLSIDEARKRSRMCDGAVCEPSEQFPHERVWVDTDVRDAITRLRRPEQQVLFLRLIEDLPFVDVARVLDRNVASTRVLYGRALGKLRKQLERGDAR